MSRMNDVEHLKWVVKGATNRRQVLAQLGLKPAGGNYKTLDRALQHHAIDTSHFTGQGWRRGLKMPAKRDLSADLRQGSSIQSFKLKAHLLRAEIFEARCYHCQGTTWMGQPIPLELEHVNGDHRDNRLENLTLLCPNCHALTPTYRGKNRADRHEPGTRSRAPADRECQACGKPCSGKYCSRVCSQRSQRKAERPTREELAAMVAEMSILAIGRKYGVSDNAVRKWLRAYGLR